MDLLTTMKIGAALVGVLAVGTMFLPRHVEVARSATLPVAPERVLALAASNEGYQRFNPYADTDPALKIDMFGPSEGVGSGFAFAGKEGKGTQTVTAQDAESVTFAIDLGAMGQPVQSIRAVEVDGGSAVTWTVQSDMGFNPVFRVFGLFMDGMMGPVFERGLAKLGRAAA